MKQHFLWLLLLPALYIHSSPLGLSLNCREPIEDSCFSYTSETFMFTQPVTHHRAIIEPAWHTLVHDNTYHSSTLRAIQMIGYYQHSLADKKVSEYFLINRKTLLSVRGDTAPGAHTRDVRAEWLGISNPEFSGYLSINPSQVQAGFTLEYLYQLPPWENIACTYAWWLDLQLPFVMMRNSMQLEQHDVSHPGTDYPSDIVQAFAQPAWHYAKIAGPMKRMQFSQLTIDIGFDYLACDGFEISCYGGLCVPFIKPQNPEYLFSPFLGNNGHLSIEAGVLFQIVFNEYSDCASWCWFVELENHFLISNEQCRTFDLKGKQWSRYLLYNHIDGPPNQNIPGVNILTQKVKAHPYSMVDFYTGFRHNTAHTELELAYSIWGHSDEQLELRCPFPQVYGIAGNGSLPGKPGSAASASKSTIAFQAENDAEFITISAFDLNLSSAAARSALNHTLSLALSFFVSKASCDTFINIGGFYEAPQKNSALRLWGSWVKIGAQF
jgi:hypothetical protein